MNLKKQIEALKERTSLNPKVQDEVVDKVLEIINTDIGNLSDGYHTFNELYHHRAVLFAMICNQNPNIAWKSKQHSDGTMFENMFIVGINTPYGQATYHYDTEPYWNYFKVEELKNAPVWDGHTPAQAIERILKMGMKVMEKPEQEPCKVCGTLHTAINYETWAMCDGMNEPTSSGWKRANFCPECGKKLEDIKV
jgi:hypothetical protein